MIKKHVLLKTSGVIGYQTCVSVVWQMFNFLYGFKQIIHLGIIHTLHVLCIATSVETLFFCNLNVVSDFYSFICKSRLPMHTLTRCVSMCWLYCIGKPQTMISLVSCG